MDILAATAQILFYTPLGTVILWALLGLGLAVIFVMFSRRKDILSSEKTAKNGKNDTVEGLTKEFEDSIKEINEKLSILTGTKAPENIAQTNALLDAMITTTTAEFDELKVAEPNWFKNTDLLRVLPNGKKVSNSVNGRFILIGFVRQYLAKLNQADLDTQLEKQDATHIRSYADRRADLEKQERQDLENALARVTNERDAMIKVVDSFNETLLKSYKSQGDIAENAEKRYEALSGIVMDDKTSSEVKAVIARTKAAAYKAGGKDMADAMAKQPQPNFTVVNGGGNGNTRGPRPGNQPNDDTKPARTGTDK